VHHADALAAIDLPTEEVGLPLHAWMYDQDHGAPARLGDHRRPLRRAGFLRRHSD
jgi:hypothetical protein